MITARLKPGSHVCRALHTTCLLCYDEYQNKFYYDSSEPYKRMGAIWKGEIQRYKRRFQEAKFDAYRRKGLISNPMREVARSELIPALADVLIIGGGIIGTSVAYWIKQRMRAEDFLVVVLERDDSFAHSSSVLGIGGIRQQFSTPESIQMSQFGAEFLRHAGEHLRILDCDKPDIEFCPMGHLFLAETEEEAKQLEEDNKIQLNNGAKVSLLNREELELRFPFMQFDNVRLASIGVMDEGVFDPWSLLSALREKSMALGVQFLKAEVTGPYFEWYEGVDPYGRYPEEDYWMFRSLLGVIIKPQRSGCAPRPIKSPMIYNCAGPWAGDICNMMGIGTGPELLGIQMPIEKRKRYVYSFYCPEGPNLDMPFLVDSSGVWVRRDGVGHSYLCGKNNTEDDDREIDHSNLSVDYNFFEGVIRPVLEKRVPAFKSLVLKNAYAGYYDVNTFDKMPIIGPHFFHSTFNIIAGFGGTGLQHAMAVGRAVQEQEYDKAYRTINLRVFNPRRIIKYDKLKEHVFV